MRLPLDYIYHLFLKLSQIHVLQKLDSRLQKNYDKLLNFLSRTDEIAAKLLEKDKIRTSQLEVICNETNKTRKNELLLQMLQHSKNGIFEHFLTALEETNQQHLLLCIQGGLVADLTDKNKHKVAIT